MMPTTAEREALAMARDRVIAWHAKDGSAQERHARDVVVPTLEAFDKAALDRRWARAVRAHKKARETTEALTNALVKYAGGYRGNLRPRRGDSLEVRRVRYALHMLRRGLTDPIASVDDGILEKPDLGWFLRTHCEVFGAPPSVLAACAYLAGYRPERRPPNERRGERLGGKLELAREEKAVRLALKRAQEREDRPLPKRWRGLLDLIHTHKST